MTSRCGYSYDDEEWRNAGCPADGCPESAYPCQDEVPIGPRKGRPWVIWLCAFHAPDGMRRLTPDEVVVIEVLES